MPKSIQRYYWDSCVFISYLENEPARAPIIHAHWERAAQRGDIQILTSAITKVEVAYLQTEKINRTLSLTELQRIDDMWDNPLVLMVEASDPVMLIARGLVRDAMAQGQTIKPYDATQLASAIWVHRNTPDPIVEFYTYDARLYRMSAVAGFPILAPQNFPQQLSYSVTTP